MKTLGFIGKPDIDEQEKLLLIQFGKVVARSGRELVIAPARGSVQAVEEGVKAEKGPIRRTAGGVLTASAHSFIYADERFLTRIRTAYPALDGMRNVFLMSSPLEIEKFLGTARKLLKSRGITYPE